MLVTCNIAFLSISGFKLAGKSRGYKMCIKPKHKINYERKASIKSYEFHSNVGKVSLPPSAEMLEFIHVFNCRTIDWEAAWAVAMNYSSAKMLPDIPAIINYQSTLCPMPCLSHVFCENDNQLTKLTGDARI